MPSCIRAPPPDPETKMSGRFISAARSAARLNFSPTTAPMLPAMNLKSVTPITTPRPRMNPAPHTAASGMPVFFCCWAIRWVYGWLSTNPRASTGFRSASHSSKLFSSSSCRSRSRAER